MIHLRVPRFNSVQTNLSTLKMFFPSKKYFSFSNRIRTKFNEILNLLAGSTSIENCTNRKAILEGIRGNVPVVHIHKDCGIVDKLKC